MERSSVVSDGARGFSFENGLHHFAIGLRLHIVVDAQELGGEVQPERDAMELSEEWHIVNKMKKR